MLGSAKDFGTSYCFVAGTLVTTEDGFKPIEKIQVGDKVLSENELTGEIAVKTVTETYVNETDELVHIGVNGETISATPTHPFYVDKLGWTLARSLKAGDVLVLSNGELVTVEFVQHEILESPIKVYNFEVQDFHTYFVGENGIFVHNSCSDHSKKLRENMDKEGRTVGQGEAAAHIVASGGEKRQWVSAKDSRNLLNKYGIDVDTAANGIPLGHPSPHNLTHTRDFNDRVNTRLHKVENRMRNNGYGRKAIRRSLQRELRAIGRQVLGGDYNV